MGAHAGMSPPHSQPPAADPLTITHTPHHHHNADRAAIKRFLTREAQGNLDYGSGFGGDAEDGEYFDAAFAEVGLCLAWMRGVVFCWVCGYGRWFGTDLGRYVTV